MKEKYTLEEVYAMIQERIRDNHYAPELIIEPKGWRFDLNELPDSGASDYTPALGENAVDFAAWLEGAG